jgi:hypothetical protein
VSCSIAETDNTGFETVSVTGRSSHGFCLCLGEEHRNHVMMKRAVDLAMLRGFCVYEIQCVLLCRHWH